MAETDKPDPNTNQPSESMLRPGWAAKSHELLVKKPLYKRSWFRRGMLVISLLIFAAATVGGLFLYRWHREQQADLTRQRHSVEAFVRSADFEAFARNADAQLVAALNYAALRPAKAGALLPEIAAIEKSRFQVAWAFELQPLPISVSTQPERVQLAVRQAVNLISNHGFVFDSARGTDARRVFLRLLSSHARKFLATNTTATFPALPLDRRMQDIVLTAYAARANATREDIDRAFVLYAIIGPSLWQELEAINDQKKKNP